MFALAYTSYAQDTISNKEALQPVKEDSTTLYKIIPAEIPRPILDSLVKRNFQMGDVFTAHRNGPRSMYVIEIAHELVRETFWFDPKGYQLRPSAKKIN